MKNYFLIFLFINLWIPSYVSGLDLKKEVENKENYDLNNKRLNQQNEIDDLKLVGSFDHFFYYPSCCVIGITKNQIFIENRQGQFKRIKSKFEKKTNSYSWGDNQNLDVNKIQNKMYQLYIPKGMFDINNLFIKNKQGAQESIENLSFCSGFTKDLYLSDSRGQMKRGCSGSLFFTLKKLQEEIDAKKEKESKNVYIEMTPPETVPEDEYGKILSENISRNKEYPRIAHMKGIEGIVEIEVEVNGKTNTQNVRLSKSSGSGEYFKMLDDSALNVVKKSLPFSINENLKEKHFTIRIPISFNIE